MFCYQIRKANRQVTVKAENLTVFAVNNNGMSKSTDNGINLKRHIVVGKYLKSSLTNGQKLLALDGTVLTIIIMGERVFVNGVVLSDEIQADNSIAYIVEKSDNYIRQYRTVFIFSVFL